MVIQKNKKPINDLADNIYTELLDTARKEGVTRFSVGAVISEGDKIVLFRRDKNDFLGGMYEIPGGGQERGESLQNCLKREVKEETGISVDKILKYLGSFDYASQNGVITRQFNFAVSVKIPIIITLSGEHDGFIWVTQKELSKLNPTKEISTALRRFWEMIEKE